MNKISKPITQIHPLIPNNSELLIIIPARNEEKALETLLKPLITSVTGRIVVVDNGSTDQTKEVARRANCIVIQENRPGYGSACLAGIKFAASLPHPPILICFFDGDGQSLVHDAMRVIQPVLSKQLQYNQGSRMRAPTSKAALTPAARIANRIFAYILSLIWKQPLTDLGPLRCISWDTLSSLQMTSTGYGWTIEMLSKLLKMGIPCGEVPVDYKIRKTGQSKISGSTKTALRAVFVMSLTLLRVIIFWRPPAAH